MSDSLDTPWTVAHQAHLSMGLSQQEYWGGLSCPPPGKLLNSGIELPPVSPALQASSLPLNHWRSPVNANIKMGNITIFTFAFCHFWTYWDIFIFKAKKFWIPKKDMAMWWKEQRTQNEDNQDGVWILPVWPGTSYLISLGAYSFNIKVTMLFEWPRKHST